MRTGWQGCFCPEDTDEQGVCRAQGSGKAPTSERVLRGPGGQLPDGVSRRPQLPLLCTESQRGHRPGPQRNKKRRGYPGFLRLPGGREQVLCALAGMDEGGRWTEGSAGSVSSLLSPPVPAEPFLCLTSLQRCRTVDKAYSGRFSSEQCLVDGGTRGQGGCVTGASCLEAASARDGRTGDKPFLLRQVPASTAACR